MDLTLIWMSQPSSLLEPCTELTKPNDYVDCFRVLGMIYLMFSIMIPSYLMWLSEIHMRINYTKNLYRENPSLYRIQRLDHIRIPERTKILILIMMSFIVFWKVSEMFRY